MTREALANRDAYRYWANIQTRWTDNDAYGHVNNAMYYQWFDTVVNRWLVENSLLDIAEGDPIGLVVETSCRYAASVTFPQVVDVGLAVQQLGTSSVSYRLGVFAQGSSTAAAEGRFVHVYVARRTRRPVPVPVGWRSVLEALIA